MSHVDNGASIKSQARTRGPGTRSWCVGCDHGICWGVRAGAYVGLGQERAVAAVEAGGCVGYPEWAPIVGRENV